jgi:serine/threonine protein kinase/Tol biopolymer transport system component
MEMTPERWGKIKALFEAALEQPAEQRLHFLDECESDKELRAEVVHLLLDFDRVGRFMEEPAADKLGLIQSKSDPGVFHKGDVLTRSMDLDRWRKIESIFHKALDTDDHRGAGVVEEFCAGDEALRREVESLLARYGAAGDFIKAPLFAAGVAPPLQPHLVGALNSTDGPAPKAVVGHYRILGKIGSGGMGMVYEAEDIKLHRHVALKFLPDKFAGDPQMLRRFRLEAQAASALNHQNICTIYEVEEAEGRVFIAMELLEGKTLEDKMAGKPLSVKTTLELGIQIASAINVAHSKGIVHRDIKPANIFVTKHGQIKILDFGLAKLTQRLAGSAETTISPNQETEPGTVMGTIGYMAPEQVQGIAVDHRIDIFAVGVILYEMLTGRRAFKRSTAAETMAAILNDDPPALSQIAPSAPLGLPRLVRRCLEKNPERRFQSAADLAFALVDLSEPVNSRAVTALPEPRSRQMWLTIAAGILTISVLAFGAVVTYRWLRPAVPKESPTLEPLPFTSLAGAATSPAFSPDGSRIAFAWNGDPVLGGKGFDLYVKAIGSETMLRLTQHPSDWLSPAWSPDGTQIAFHRTAGADSGIYLVSGLGGPERKLRSTRVAWAAFGIISWSPDGKWIAFADLMPEEEHARIYLLSTETWETKRIPSIPKCIDEGLPAFSHSGEFLAYWCFGSENDTSIYTVPLQGGHPKLISQFRNYPDGLTWSADDKGLIYSLGFGPPPHKLCEVNVANGSVKALSFALSAEQPTVSPKSDKLAYSLSADTLSMWRRNLLNPETPAIELTPSSRDQENAQYSPDGKRIVFASNRSGVRVVWVSNVDGSDLVQISNPHDESGSPQWSPDGKKIAFDSRPKDRWEIYIADASERVPRRLITNLSDIYKPHWSRDGTWINFRSDEFGKRGIYRCPASGGDAIALSKDTEASSPQESFDGATIYFAGGVISYFGGGELLKRAPLVQGQVGADSAVDGLRLGGPWTVSPGGIYFVPAGAPKSLRYFDFATKQVRPVLEVDKDFGGGLSVSPDGLWIIYSQHNMNSDIMLVETGANH